MYSFRSHADSSWNLEIVALNYAVRLGTIVICNYNTGFTPPEMVKNRLAVVMSPRLPHRDNLCCVVPLSTTPSRRDIAYQCRIELEQSPPRPFEGTVKWVKADMLATVSYQRLDLPKVRDPISRQRRYLQIRISDEQINYIRSCILYSLNLGHLTQYL